MSAVKWEGPFCQLALPLRQELRMGVELLIVAAIEVGNGSDKLG